MGPLAIGGLIGMGGDILGGLTKLAGGIAGACGAPEAGNIMTKVGDGIKGVSGLASSLMGGLGGIKF